MHHREDAPPWINIASRARSREIPIHAAITLTRTLPRSLTPQLTKNSRPPKPPPAPLPSIVSLVGRVNKGAPHLTVNQLTRILSTLTHFRPNLITTKTPSKASLSPAPMTRTPSQKVTRLSSGLKTPQKGVTFHMLGSEVHAPVPADLDVSQKGVAALTASALRFTLIQGS